MKTHHSLLLAAAIASVACPGFLRADDKEPEASLDELLGDAIEDAVRGLLDDGKKPDGEESEDERLKKMLEKMLKGGENSLSPDELQELFGKNLLERLKKDGGAFKLELEGDSSPERLEQLSRLMRGLLGEGSNGENERETAPILEDYRPVVERARKSTARVMVGKKQIALATVVREDGFLLTKASEVEGQKNLECEFTDGFRIGGTVADTFPTFDLALLKIDVAGLPVIEWDDRDDLPLGAFLAASGTDELPLAIGVASVKTRSLSDRNRGFLGVMPVWAENSIRIDRVTEKSAAAEAGLQEGDIILGIGDERIESVNGFIEKIGNFRPGDVAEIWIRRQDEEKKLPATLRDRAEALPTIPERGFDAFSMMGGPLSKNRDGYPSALQTDLTIKPNECGGPLLDLDGRAVGINIARAGRVNSYAIPAAEIRRLVGQLPDGKFALIDTRALEDTLSLAREEAKAAEAALEDARERAERTRKKIEETEKALREAQKPQ
jgi:serine protease Do